MNMGLSQPSTLFDKIWSSRVVTQVGDQTLLYVDKTILHEGSTPLAFEAMRNNKRVVQRPEAMLGVIDHTIPTIQRSPMVAAPDAMAMMAAFKRDAAEFKIPIFDEHDPRQGIVHVVGPEQGFTLPGTVIVCGDSHTSTHGAFGAFAFGIGSTEIEHVFATGTLWRNKPRNMLVEIEGEPPSGVTAKDLVLTIIGAIGVGGAVGCVIEFSGSTVRNLSMEGRMTLCNMAIEAGARAGLVAPDDVTYAYLQARPWAPKGELWTQAVAHWRSLASDSGAIYDRTVRLNAPSFQPMVTWGTTPEDVAPATGEVPDPDLELDPTRRAAMSRALAYMGLTPGTPLGEIEINRVFIGSCTNGRIEDLRAAADILRGRKIDPGVRAMVVPGSGLVKRQAEEEGLDAIFQAAGFEWREPGCSMCLAMNGDRLDAGDRCAATSNRNFEGRQGRGGRTHLMSPAMAASSAVTGRLGPLLPSGTVAQ